MCTDVHVSVIAQCQPIISGVFYITELNYVYLQHENLDFHIFSDDSTNICFIILIKPNHDIQIYDNIKICLQYNRNCLHEINWILPGKSAMILKGPVCRIEEALSADMFSLVYNHMKIGIVGFSLQGAFYIS